ncbi:cytoskeletal protein binding protein [Coemansia sp. RSA 989]|nr:cytoskeletal protein binding protein [Coemansia sp. RSA 989]
MPLVEVRRAIYAYTPADGDELEMHEDDVLYIVNNDDVDWLQAKRKQLDINEPEKQGLVPANHTEIIAPIARAKALYAYEPALEEETTLAEDEEVDIIEQDDPDWYMARTRGGYGFVPKAYVEIVSGEPQGIVDGTNANSAAPPIPQQLPPSPKFDVPAPILDAPVPSIPPSQAPVALSPPLPPPLPPISSGQPSAPLPSEPAAKPAAPKTAEVDSISHFNVVLGKKKKGQKVTLGVSNPTLIVDSNDDTALPKRYSTGDISRCSTKKTLLTVEIGGVEPAAYDFTCSSNSEAERIADAINAARRGMFIGDRMIEPQTNLQQQQQQQQPPKEDVPFALPGQTDEPMLSPNIDAPFVSPPSSSMPPNSQEHAKVLYDFSSDDPEELSVKEGDTVLILDKSDPDWWQVRESPPNGRAGLVPAAYVEIQPAEALPPVPKRTETVRKAAAQVHQSSLQQQQQQQQQDLPPLHIEPPPRMETPRHTENSVAAILRGDKTPDSDNVPLQFLQKRPEEAVPPPMPKRPSEAAKPAGLGPDPSKVRTWTDGSGAYTVEAQFIKLDREGNVHLHKANSKKITVPLTKFSDADRRYVSSVTGQSLPEVKTARQRQQEDAKKTPGRRIINYDWDWFDFFTLKCGITADNALKYATSFVAERLDDASIPEITVEYMKTLGVKPADIPRLERALREHQGLPASEASGAAHKDQAMQSPRGLAMELERTPSLPPAYTSIASEPSAKEPIRSPPAKEPAKEPAQSPRRISNNPWGVDSELDRRFDRRRQIEDDEALARQLQQQEEDERRHGHRRKHEPKHKQPLNLGIGSRKMNKSQTSVVDPAQLRTAQQRLGSPPARAASPPLGSPLKSPLKSPQSYALKSSSQTAIDLAFAPQMEQVPPPRARPAPRQTTQQQPVLAQSPPAVNQQQQQQQSTDLTTHNMAAATASGNMAQMMQLEQMAKARAQELALQESRIKQQQEEMRKQAQFLQQQQQQLLQMQQTQKVEAQLKQLKEEKERMEKQRQAEELQKQAAMIKAQQEQLLKMQQMAAQARSAQQSAPTALSSVSMPQTQAITNMSLGMATPMSAGVQQQQQIQQPQMQQVPLSSRLPPPLVPTRASKPMQNPANLQGMQVSSGVFSNHAIAGSTPNLGTFGNPKPLGVASAAYSNNPVAAQSMSNFGVFNQPALPMPSQMNQPASKYDLFKSVNPHAPSIFTGASQQQQLQQPQQQLQPQFSMGMNMQQPGISRPNGPTGIFAMSNPTLTHTPQVGFPQSQQISQQQIPQQQPNQIFNTNQASGFGGQIQWH